MTLKLARPALLLASLAFLAACERAAEESTPSPMPTPGAPTPQAPAEFRVLFETSKGEFTVEVRREWAPNGVDRFHQLVTSGYFEGNRFFRVVPGFVVQFGLHGDPAVASTWEPLRIADDPVVQSNRRGTLVFATAGPNTRTTQLFINFADNTNLDGMGFAPFGTIVEGMDVVDRINAEYGEQPNQGLIAAEGSAYLERDFPRLDLIRSARVLP